MDNKKIEPNQSIKSEELIDIHWSLPLENKDKIYETSRYNNGHLKYEKEDFNKRQNEKLDIPLIVSKELENLIQKKMLYIRDGRHYGLKRLNSIMNKKIIMFKDDSKDINILKHDEIKILNKDIIINNRSNNIRLDINVNKLNFNYFKLKRIFKLYENKYNLLKDKDLLEGSICIVLYSDEYNKYEIEYFQIIHYNTLIKAIDYILKFSKSSNEFIYNFSDINLSQYCPTIFWNIVRIYNGEIDKGIDNIFATNCILRNKRKKTINFKNKYHLRSNVYNNKIKTMNNINDISEYYMEENIDKKYENDVFHELSQLLIDDLIKKIPFYKRNNISYIKDIDIFNKKDENFQKKIDLEDEIEDIKDEKSNSRRSNRVSSGINNEKDIINIFIDKKYRLIRFPIESYSDKWKKVIYKYCIINNIHSSILIKKDSLKGRCVIAGSLIRKDDFVLEYKGNLITQLTRAEELERFYARNNKGCFMYYFKYNDKNYCIDATDENKDFGPGRLINHSKKNPNIITKVLFVEKTPRLFFVSKRDIMCGEELLFDYGDNDPISTLNNPWLLNS